MTKIAAIVEGDGEVEAADQAALTARFDMALARRRSPSFDKMWRATAALLQ